MVVFAYCSSVACLCSSWCLFCCVEVFVCVCLPVCCLWVGVCVNIYLQVFVLVYLCVVGAWVFVLVNTCDLFVLLLFVVFVLLKCYSCLCQVYFACLGVCVGLPVCLCLGVYKWIPVMSLCYSCLCCVCVSISTYPYFYLSALHLHCFTFRLLVFVYQCLFWGRGKKVW